MNRSLPDSIAFIQKASTSLQKIGDVNLEGCALIAQGRAQNAMGDQEKVLIHVMLLQYL